MKGEFKKVLELKGMQSIQLLCAFQALTMPSKFFSGVTHKRARDVIEEITGKRPKGKPEIGGGLEAYLSWHLGGEVVEMERT